ncbi:expressed unknown protein [Seminavis robusta]|uniref:Cytochrome P450 n=1 Tax=Seminavis robusta TaxID=568900 RepID=A0A9N8ET95_9STRA|nr:expressed unknown protein [Seminavis robusta]|eukprot:Sro1623_g286670.1 n/a (291) ;mRNA; r:22132-23004
MIFQDKVEDATAKAAVLPRFLALPLCLWPTQAARRQLQQSLAAILQQEIWNHHGSKDSMGPWAQTYLEEGTSPERAAEHLIGLIFAGHKNPSIGAGQSLCFLRTELSSEQQQCATQEARQLCAAFQDKNKNLTEALLNATTLRACVLETMRVTLGAIRYAESAVKLPGDMIIEAGETVSLAHHAMHMEPSLWGDNPAQFSLDRWQQQETTNNDSSLEIPVDHYKLTTFSNGLHKCPGEKVALAMMELWLAIMLTRDAQLVGDLPPVSFERATLAQREGPVGFSVRSSSSS